MKVGVTLPQFRDDPEHALVAARAADEIGNIDGVFVFDHLWAIGQPHRPALSAWPLLGALAEITERVTIGPLVARVSLLADAVLEHHVRTMLRLVGPERFIAGLGAGDRLSKPENESYGVPFPSLDERVARLRDCAERCERAGATVWIGGLHPKVAEVAVDVGVAQNVWGVEADAVREVGERVEVTWGGVVADRREGATETLRWVRAAGATWCVLAPPYSPTVDPTTTIKTISEQIDAA